MMVDFKLWEIGFKLKKDKYYNFKQKEKHFSRSGFDLLVFWREEVFYMCLLSFTSIWSVKYAQFFYTDVALLWYSPGRDWFLYQTLLQVSHLIVHRIVSSALRFSDQIKTETVGNIWVPVQPRGAAAPSANTCSSLLCVPYDFTDLLM